MHHSSRPRRQHVRAPLNQDPEALRVARIAARMRPVDLARAAEISKGHMSELEGGTRSASPELLGRLAVILGCDVRELINKVSASE
ncbi:transcriptional regulator with XRE-family HTH domain [Streptosporangium becharense]|uniref:Transcriptional regulator with XRE-family HTH domain n=1 Tax=Streptosporangium becharense TaxID=1816182 RepID=A0A7W9MGV4_9ACTN|nr:helix-turn-helix transcriptional regulator [Streptosporangium becharense]MBB2914919.1 transcriptional regulator with XRE-family HTH domain [Streptosporangium becharense]MBB5820270.1 transcriptional regulator with XRE-family HTH domain [Streptosporangium becharense]